MDCVTPDTKLSDLLQASPSVVGVLHAHGLGCAACLGAQFETVRDAARAHEIDMNVLIQELSVAVLDVNNCDRSTHEQ